MLLSLTHSLRFAALKCPPSDVFIFWCGRLREGKIAGGKSRPSATIIYLVCNHKNFVWKSLLHRYSAVLLIICDLSANSMIQSCADAPIEANFKAENLFSNRSDKTNWCVHCVCRSLFFYIVTSKFLSARFFHRILMFSLGPATLHSENLLYGAIILPVNLLKIRVRRY